MGLHAGCLTGLLLSSERTLKSLLSEKKRVVRLATNYFLTSI